MKSKHQGALPVIITHGWPGSVIELLKIIDPLTNPTAHGGTEADAFDVVIPSMPGYGFSGKPTETGWGPERIARAWTVLMKRLGYNRYVAQGGDWGALITEQMALLAPPELIAIHTNMPGTIPPEIVKALAAGSPPPADLGPDEKQAYEQVAFFYKYGLGYANEMALRPQTLYGIVEFTGRFGVMDSRPRRGQLCADRPLLRWRAGGPYPRRHPRQHHALLADEHGHLVGAALLGTSPNREGGLL